MGCRAVTYAARRRRAYVARCVRILTRRLQCPLKQRELLLLGDRGVKSRAFHVRRGKLFGSRVSCKPSKSPLHGKCEWHTVVNWAHGFVRLGRRNGESVVLPNPSQKKGRVSTEDSCSVAAASRFSSLLSPAGLPHPNRYVCFTFRPVGFRAYSLLEDS